MNLKFSLFLFLIFLFMSFVKVKAADTLDLKNPLPNWIDKSREKNLGISKADEALRFSTLPSQGVKLLPEYAPAQAVVMGWAGYPEMLKSIASAATNEGRVQIWVAGGPSSIPGVSADKYIKSSCPINTVWVRDYGPFGITGEGQLGIVDSVYRHYSYRPEDDRMPSCLADEHQITSFPMGIILDGGNLMVDGAGNLFMTNRTYIWNKDKSKEEVDKILKSYLGVNNIHVFDYAGYPGEPADGTGHIDMFVKLLNDETVLIAKADTEPFKTAAEKAASYFANLKTPKGGNYKIIRIKGWKSSRAWYTYTNSLIVNNVVLMPVYSGHEQDDNDAVKAYETGMPGVKVVKINSDSSITYGGAIHCVTQLIPATK